MGFDDERDNEWFRGQLESRAIKYDELTEEEKTAYVESSCHVYILVDTSSRHLIIFNNSFINWRKREEEEGQ